MVTSVKLLDLSEYSPLILWVNTPTFSVFGVEEPFHFKVGLILSLSPSVISTNLSISVNFGNGSPTVVSMVLPLRGCSSASVLVTVTLTLRVVTLPEPSSEVIVTSLPSIFLVTLMSSDESGLSSLPAPCLILGAFVKPEILNFSI